MLSNDNSTLSAIEYVQVRQSSGIRTSEKLSSSWPVSTMIHSEKTLGRVAICFEQMSRSEVSSKACSVGTMASFETL